MTFGTCHYCKREMVDPKRRAKLSATRDHVTPRCQGGRKTVPCCRHCNHLKADMHPQRWAKVMNDFPRWWKTFHTHGDLIRAMRAKAMPQTAKHERRVIIRWPVDVLVARPPLCRGLAR